MKNTSFLVFLLVLALAILSCKAVPTPAPEYREDAAATPDLFAYPTAPGLTPASMDVIVGDAVPTIIVGSDWPSYKNDELGFAVNFPPSWQALPIPNSTGVALCPPGSVPGLPTPMIRIEWLNIPYSPDQPLVQAGGPVSPFQLVGMEGRAYQDSQFALPTQSFYIELPFHDGTLFFTATEGPNVDLTPQLDEILKTFVLFYEASGSENQNNSTSSNSFEKGILATEGWQNTQIHVQAGTTLTFETVAGVWSHWTNSFPFNTGDGNTGYICAEQMPASQCVEPLPDFPTGALIGEINGQVFGIGSGNVITAEESGTLYLRINDSDEGLFDNYGELTTRVTLSN